MASMAEPLPETLERVGRRCALLFASALKDSKDDTRTRLEELISRFKIWAGNIGLFANGRAGIDYRFESDTGARDVLFSMLLSLSRALQRVKASDSSDTEKQTQSSFVNREMPISANENAIDSASDESSLSEDSAASSPNNTRDTPAIKVAEDIVNQLYKILKLVKSSTSSSEYARVVKFASQNCDKEEDTEFESWIRFSIKKEMPFAAENLPGLVDRLADAALYRRWRMRYKNEHARKLCANVEELLPSRPDGGILAETSLLPVTATQIPAIVIDNIVPSEPKVRFTAVPHTEASTVQKLTMPITPKSVTPTVITQSGIMRRGKLDIPSAPIPESGASHEIVCPYCSQIISSDFYGTSKTNKARWARHVVQDCAPYVCLFDYCTKPLMTQYSSQNEWLQHMLWGHTRRYHCKAAGHQDQIFDSEEAFRSHLSEHHNEDTDSPEVEEIVKRAMVSTNDLYKDLQGQFQESLEDGVCILCGNNILEPGSSSPQTQSMHAPEMSYAIRTHLATHLEELGLLSLPPNQDDGSGGADSNESAHSLTSKANNFEGLLPVRPCNSFENVFENSNYLDLLSSKDANSQIPDLDNDRLMLDDYHQEFYKEYRSLPLDEVGEHLPEPGPSEVDLNWAYIAKKDRHMPYNWQADPVLSHFNQARNERADRVSGRWRAVLDFLTHHNATWRVPFERNPFFVGQELELDRAMSVLFNKHHTLKKLAFTGLGGIGKTQFVLELLFRIKERHRNCSVVWIRSTSIKDFHQECFEVVNKSIGSGGYNQKEYLGKFLQTYLSIDSVRLPIVVFDGVDDLAVVDRIIDSFPECKSGVMLFTTRDKRIARKLASESVDEVRRLDLNASFKLLQKSSNTVYSPEINPPWRLLFELRHIPLAIAGASAYLKTSDSWLEAYKFLLDAQGWNLADLLSEEFEARGRYHNSSNALFTTWKSTFDRIKQEHPFAAEQLSFMACIAPSKIPPSLLPDGLPQTSRVDAIETLLAFSFIRFGTQGDNFDIHGLVHLAVRNNLRHEGLLKGETEQAMVRLDEVFPIQDHQSRPMWSTFLPHALRLVEDPTCLHEMDDTKAKLSRKVANCFNLNSNWDDAVRILDLVLENRKDVLEPNSPESFDIMGSLATAYRGQCREDEAEKLRMDIVERQTRLLGEHHLETLSSKAELAVTYRNQGRLEEAESLGSQVLKARREKLAYDHPDVLSSMANLAETYRFQGCLKTAEALAIHAMEDQRSKFGIYHSDTLASMHNLSLIWDEQGRDEEAKFLMVKCVSGRRFLLGAEHPETVSSTKLLAGWQGT
ncbi:hypothetical protein IQ07DRAFT_548555 [Pyrenochaeta sp. DS3sAY3a]|nr:hypothetical protein IQ07DRAFT_548555 [Pyrenochaeta sp. DS3sAY3a]